MKHIRIVVSNTGVSIFKPCLLDILNVWFLSLPAWLAPGWDINASNTCHQWLCMPEMGSGRTAWPAQSRSHPSVGPPSFPPSLYLRCSLTIAENACPSIWSGWWSSCSFEGNCSVREEGRLKETLNPWMRFQVAGFASKGKMCRAAWSPERPQARRWVMPAPGTTWGWGCSGYKMSLCVTFSFPLCFFFQNKSTEYRAQVLVNHLVFRLFFLGATHCLYCPGRMLSRCVDRISMCGWWHVCQQCASGVYVCGMCMLCFCSVCVCCVWGCVVCAHNAHTVCVWSVCMQCVCA